MEHRAHLHLSLKSASKNHFQRLVEGPGPRRPQEVVQLPHSRRPAPSRAAALRRRQQRPATGRCRCPAAPAALQLQQSPGPPCCGRSWRPRPPAAACTASAGSSRSSVTTKFPSSPVSSRAARLVARPTVSAFLFCRGSTAASRVKTSITTRPYFVFPRVFWLKSMRSACSRSLGPSAADLPSARGRGACTCRPTSAFSASKAMACVTELARVRR